MNIILIGGSEGLLGSQLRDEFLSHPDTVVFGFDLKKHTLIGNKRYFYVSGSINNDKDVNFLNNQIKKFQIKNNIVKSMNAIINCIAEPEFSYIAENIPDDLPEDEHFIWGWKNYPSSQFEKQMNTNVAGTHRLLTSIFERYSESTNCSIVNLSSQYALKVPNQDLFKTSGKYIFKGPGYSASKIALINYTEYLAKVFAGSGIRANCIAPGAVINGQKKEFIDNYSKSVLSGRMMFPNEITSIVKFLVSSESSYINGSCLVADGGWSIK
jgi:NAD(P)-dependent dehydrogenase (short-subunit alcohol dehydrogenase family)